MVRGTLILHMEVLICAEPPPPPTYPPLLSAYPKPILPAGNVVKRSLMTFRSEVFAGAMLDRPHEAQALLSSANDKVVALRERFP